MRSGFLKCYASYNAQYNAHLGSGPLYCLRLIHHPVGQGGRRQHTARAGALRAAAPTGLAVARAARGPGRRPWKQLQATRVPGRGFWL